MPDGLSKGSLRIRIFPGVFPKALPLGARFEGGIGVVRPPGVRLFRTKVRVVGEAAQRHRFRRECGDGCTGAARRQLPLKIRRPALPGGVTQ
jgi:hypothetical protein